MMEKIEIGVCDDDLEFCVRLGKQIRRAMPEAQIHIYTSAEELLENQHKPQILFLDVRMEGMDGMEAAKRLREMNGELVIVFVSGDPDYVFDAFDVDALHYLVKPVAPERLESVLHKAADRLTWQENAAPQMLISKRGQTTRVFLEDIRWAEVFNRTIVLHTRRGDVEYCGKLGDLERKLGQDFFRTHRAYIVNCRHVDSYDSRFCQIGKENVPIAKKNHAAFVQHFMQFMRRQGGPV